MFDHILGEINPSEQKRIQKLYKEIVTGKADISTLNYDDAVRIEAELRRELNYLKNRSRQCTTMIDRLLKRESCLTPIYDAVSNHLISQREAIVVDVFGTDASSTVSSIKESDPPFCPWEVVDDRTQNLYLAVHKGAQSFDDLDLSDRWVILSMKENRERLSTFVAQIQSVIDAADEGKMHLNSLNFEDMQTLAKAIDRIISK